MKTRALILVLSGATANSLNELPCPTVHMLAGLGIHGAVRGELAEIDPAPSSFFRLVESSSRATTIWEQCTPAILLQELTVAGTTSGQVTPSRKHERAVPPTTAVAESWASYHQSLANEHWDAFLIWDESLEHSHGCTTGEDRSLHESSFSELDQNLAATLGMLDEQTAVLLLVLPTNQASAQINGFCAMADPQGRLKQPEHPVAIGELVDALSRICDWGQLTKLHDSPLLGQANDSDSVLSDEQEEILRERLGGLGYLG